MEEVKTPPTPKASSENIIITIDGISYNVTDFAETHPGGRKILERSAMMEDAGQNFRDVGHSKEAMRLINLYRIDNNEEMEGGKSSDKIYNQPLEIESREIQDKEQEESTPSKEAAASTTNNTSPKMWVKHLAIISASLSWSLIILLSSQSGAGFWSDWTRQYPYAGQAGFGKFAIRGTSGQSMDYPWRRALPSYSGTILAWILCVVHVGLQWLILFLATKEKNASLKNEGVPRYSHSFDKWNVLMLLTNILAISLGFLHKRIYYDGLAGTLSESVAQNAVVFYLSVVLLMETPRRGIFFHRGRGYFRFGNECQKSFLDFLKRNHGYLFSLAFTVNYHYQALESTSSHFFGYFYQMLLIFQGTLLFNHAHKNRSWTFWLESLVLLHAMGVAIIQNRSALLMFTFGFALVTMVTQLWGLPVVEEYLFISSDGGNTKANVGYPIIVGLLWITPVTICGMLGLFSPVTAFLIPIGLATLYVVVALFFWIGFKFHQIIENRRSSSETVVVVSKVFIVTYAVAATALAFVISVALVGGAKPGLYKFATPGCGVFFYSNGTNETLAVGNECFV